MSFLFGVDLLFPRPRLRTALEALARLANPSGHTGCEISIPGEPPLRVPFDACAEDEDGPLAGFDCARIDRLQWLEGSLWLPIDDAVRAYLGMGEPHIHMSAASAGERASIGLFTLYVYCGVRYSIVRVGAVTSSMSCLLDDSAAVRETFLRLVREAGGVGALLDKFAGMPHELLGEPGREVELPRYDWEDPAGTVDRFVDAALAAGMSTG